MELIKNLLCTSFALLFSFVVFAGDYNDADDVETQLKELSSLSWEYINKKPDSAIFYSEKQKELAKSVDDKIMLAKAYYAIGVGYFNKKLYDQAAYNFFIGLESINTLGEKGMVRRKYFYGGLGNIYEQIENFELALHYYTLAFEIAQKQDYIKHIDLYSYNIGVVYEKQEEFSDAKRYYTNVIESQMGKTERDVYLLAKALNSLGNVYNQTNAYDSARSYYLQVLELSNNEPELKSEKPIYLSNLGENYNKQGDFQLAKNKYLEALAFSKQISDSERSTWILNNIGDLLYKQNNYQESIDYYQECIALCMSTDDVIDKEYNRALKKMALVYEAQGKYDLALDYKSKFIAQLEKIEDTKENLAQKNAQFRIKAVEWKMEKWAKEAKIAKIETENIWVKLLVTLALIVIVVGSRYTYIYHKKIARIRQVVYMDDVDLE